MARTLIEQYRRFGPAAEDPVQFGDGAPMHSHIPFDMMRSLNNLQTYCEPSFQYAYDIGGIGGDGGGASYIRYTCVNDIVGGTGTAMLGQLPVLVPVKAKRLWWTFGYYRAVPGEVGIDIETTAVTMYLASGPCTYLVDGVVDNPTPLEGSRLFNPGYISGPYSSNSIASVSIGGTGKVYKLTTNSGFWENFVTDDNINDRTGDPWAYLIVTIDFESAVVGNSIYGAELSFWGQYE